MPSRDEQEASLREVVFAATRDLLSWVYDEATTALRRLRSRDVSPGSVLALGAALGWWDRAVDGRIVAGIEEAWRAAYTVTLRDGSTTMTARSEAMAFHVSAVRDRLSRKAEPEIPLAAFDQVRENLSAASLLGWDLETQARDLAERLAWEPDKSRWKQVKAEADAGIDEILDPLGPPGSTARRLARQSDPRVLALQEIRRDALAHINADEHVWQNRAERICRTESTAAWNSGTLAALEVEGRTHKRWVATSDARTRHSHTTANGQVVPLFSPFIVGGYSLQMPGDPSAPPQEVVSCRCTIVGADAPALTAAGTDDDFSKTLSIMALPASSDPCHGFGDEDKHATVLYFGEIPKHADPALVARTKPVLLSLLASVAQEYFPFTAQVKSVEPLGDAAQVWMLDSPDLHDVFDALLGQDDVRAVYDGADATRYPEYLPHVSIVYSEDADDVPEGADQITEISFDRISLWWGDERQDFGTPVLTASADEQWRVPRGNGRLSGRWVDMPSTILERLFPVEATGGRAKSVDLHPATPEDKEAFKKQFGRSIPPAWSDVSVDLSPGADLIARGKDRKGRSVYLYTEAFRARQDAAKFARLGQVVGQVSKIENGLERLDGDPAKAAARLMMLEGIRVGSTDEQRGDAKAYGATTLRREHASLNEDGTVGLKFVAKEGIPVEYTLDDPELVSFLTARLAEPGADDDLLFETDSNRTMDLLRELSGLSTMKNHDLRTLLANRLALQELYSMIPPPPGNEREAAKLRRQIGARVAEQLRNKPSQALASYINPAVFAPLYEGV